MAFGSFDKAANAPMAEINTTPFVDVMLVLLVVFIIATPLLSNRIPLDLPKAQAQTETDPPKAIRLAIQADGKVFWNDGPMPATELAKHFALAAKANPQVELHIFADKNVRYEAVAQALAQAQENGISKIGFATEAPARTVAK